MITVHKKLDEREDFELILRHSDDVFDVARTIFFENEHIKKKSIAVTNDKKEIIYFLKYEQNQVNVEDYVDDFWNYNIYDKNIDYELLDRGQVYIFLELEEYTFQIAKIIQMHYKDKKIFFVDDRAAFFFKEGENLHIVPSIKEIYNNYKESISKSIITIDSKKEFLHNQMRFIIKRYRSLSVMTSLFWKCNPACFGDENSNRTFYLIKNTLDNGGMADLIKFTLYRVVMVIEKNENIIPIIDLSVEGDNNQFNNGDGTNVWTMFFEQITDVPLEAVYRSKNVIISKDKLDFFNPYILEKNYFSDWKLMFQKYLKFNKRTNQYVEELYSKTIPDKEARVLGVIGRGTDYFAEKGRWVPEPLAAKPFLDEVMNSMKEWKCEYIFLATEDQKIYEVFMKSEVKEQIFSVDQERINYDDEKNKNLFLSEIKVRDKINGYNDNLRYLGILWILSKCTSLISTCGCGAFQCAVAFNNEKYENIKTF